MDREVPDGQSDILKAPSGQPGSQQPKPKSPDLIPREYLRTIAIWSLVPSYAVAGGLLGYGADKWLGTYPYLTGLGLLLALVLAVRDIYRLHGAL